MKKTMFLAVFALSGCATPSHKIGAAYISPMTYHSYTCEQLAAETYRIGSRLHQLGVDVDKEARGDKWAMGVGLFLFWPALFMVDGDKAMQSEYARLKGEYEAIQQAGVAKGCVGGGPPQQIVATPGMPTAAPQATSPADTPQQGAPYELDPAKRCDSCQRLKVP